MSVADKLQVLVVDDTSVSRMLICDGLDQLGIKNVSIAKDGKAALDAMMSKPRHLVISDYHMPNMDGLELLKSLRGFKPTSKCGFILITGQADAHTIAQGKVLGMNNVLKKPFTVDGLKSCIQSIVGKL